MTTPRTRLRRSHFSAADLLALNPRWVDSKIDNFSGGGEFEGLLDSKSVWIKRMCTESKQIVKYNSWLYILLPSEMTWHYAKGLKASRYFSNSLGFDNVTVKFYAAAEPYIDYAMRISSEVTSVPPSVCFWTWRLSVSLHMDYVKFGPVSDGLDATIKSVTTSRTKGFCISPVLSIVLPRPTR